MSIITSLMAVRVYTSGNIQALSEYQANLIACMIIDQRYNKGIKVVPSCLSSLNQDEVFFVQLQIDKLFKSNSHIEIYDKTKAPSGIEIAATLLMESSDIFN